MTTKAIVVNSQDRDLEALIRGCGTQTSVAPLTSLIALAQPGAAQPTLIVLDLRRETTVPPALTQLKRQHPGTGVVIVAAKPDPELMLSAMRAGVNEYVIEPLSAEAIEAAVLSVVSRAKAVVACQIFAFVGAKGGVGTTALAVNVATTLARVATSGALLIDLHASHGDSDLYLGVDPRFSVADALENIHKIDEAYFKTLVTRCNGRLDLLAAPEHPVPAAFEPARVQELLEFASRHFDYIVLDVPHTDTAMLEALGAAKSIVVVTTQELPAVRAATKLAGTLRHAHGKDRVQVVVSRQDKQSDIRHEDVERVLGESVTHAFPSDYRLTLASLNKGRPVVLDNQSKLAASFKSFTHTLAGIKSESRKQPPSAGVFGWLGKRK